jgi:ubiquinone/menaquinone biosynthesis C-methylase UbiE
MNKNSSDIKQFWSENPVGESLINSKYGNKNFFLQYDEFRYKTESHILDEMDGMNFRNKDVLEIGIGQGADSIQMVKRGANYFGIDLTDVACCRVKERFSSFNLPYKEILTADAENIPFKNDFFDIIYSHGVIHHSPNIKVIVDEIHRVLKPGGTAIIMLYHKNSFNYYLSIAFFRRIGLLLLLIFPFLSKVVQKLANEPKERIDQHRNSLIKNGISYLHMKNFIHCSTDGPLNIYSSVWTKNSAHRLFSKFKKFNTKIHFLNERHLLGFQYFLKSSFKKILSEYFGWHLWIYVEK